MSEQVNNLYLSWYTSAQSVPIQLCRCQSKGWPLWTGEMAEQVKRLTAKTDNLNLSLVEGETSLPQRTGSLWTSWRKREPVVGVDIQGEGPRLRKCWTQVSSSAKLEKNQVFEQTQTSGSINMWPRMLTSCWLWLCGSLYGTYKMVQWVKVLVAKTEDLKIHIVGKKNNTPISCHLCVPWHLCTPLN